MALDRYTGDTVLYSNCKVLFVFLGIELNIRWVMVLFCPINFIYLNDLFVIPKCGKYAYTDCRKWWYLRSLWVCLLATKTYTKCLQILYRYFIALREIYQNVCPEVPGNPWDVIFPDAERGGGKCNISGIPGNRGTNVLVYFPRSNEITVMLHFTREKAWKIDPKF